MQKLLSLTTLILVLSCNETGMQQQQKKEVSKESKFKILLTKYKDISFDTLEIFSSAELESIQNKFKGTQLDSAEVSLFPKALSEQYFYDRGFFACYKFSIDSTMTALITRTPSTYEPSSIKLLVFDN